MIERKVDEKNYRLKAKDQKYMQVRVRFNDKSDGVSLCWRVLIDGVENYADYVEIIGGCSTTMDEVNYEYKHHISCLAKDVSWIGRKCFVKTV
jgi:hypothetical protein